MDRPVDIDDLARRGLDIEQLHPEQRRAVEAALSGRDVLAVLPTGSGKSAIYQLAGAALPGPTVVVSPLIALQQDQVVALRSEQVGEAVPVNSSLSASQRREAFEDLRQGEAEFVFLAPEQLARPEVVENLRASRPSVFVVDEAHCISSWGHDFRPDYLGLGRVVDALGHPVVLALTATAAPPVRAEIIARLGLRDPEVVLDSFDRPNIRLSVEHPEDAREKDGAVLDRASVLAAGHRSGIVYVATRKRTEELAEALNRRGLRAAAYHAGLRRADRDRVQERFMGDEVDVIVATTAFGMGIDKPDVRFVLHADAPESLDSYYQEIGRAGRDGRDAEAVLFFRQADLGVRRFLGSGGGVKADQVGEVLEVLDEAGGSTDLEDLERSVGLSRRRLVLALSRLEDGGAVELDGDEVRAEVEDPDDAIRAVEAEEEQRRELTASRVEMVTAYAETRACRRRLLLGYFGERYDHECGSCDTCESGTAARRSALLDQQPHPIGSRVRHGELGEGQVAWAEGETLIVLFDAAGYQRLSSRRDPLETVE